MKISCANCKADNSEDRKFCKKCGAKLAEVCGSCGFTNQSDADFCGGCGLKLTKFTSSEKTEQDAERRQLTVMFCDLVGSSELAEKLDPEELRQILRSYQQCVAEVTLRYGGHIAKYIGDGLLIYFGHPHAHEDDARRSILAGLGIIEEIKNLNRSLVSEYSGKQNIKLKVRLGIHTGLVVVGQMGSGSNREENAIVGETPNIAARVEKLAHEDTVAITEETKALVNGLFILESLGKEPLKGVSHSIEIFRVLAEKNYRSEFHVRRRHGITPVVGRDRELDFLSECWEQAKNGVGQIVMLTGEAGVGKSRVVSEFMSRVSDEPQHLRLYRCSSVHTNSAFYPIINYLKQLLNIDKDVSEEVAYKSVVALFDHFLTPLGQYAPFFAPLMGVKVVGQDAFVDVSPEKTKELIFSSWLGLMEQMALEHPLLLIFEDTHWIDPSTQELINIICRNINSKRILFFITSRPGSQLITNKEVVMQSLTLGRLSQKQSYEMVTQLAGNNSLPEEVIQELIAKTDGIPLFVEELTKTVLDSGQLKLTNKRYELAGPLASMAIPNTLKDSLMARLDQLSTVKKIAQVASTIGREFSIDLLKSLPIDGFESIDNALQKLINSRLIVQHEDSEESVYQFRHALLQETAYESLLKTTRREYHELIADALKEKFPETVDASPGMLALHYTEAGKSELAIQYWLAAGNKSNQTSSHNEAISHFTKAIEILNSLPETEENMELEFQFQVRLIGPLIASKSYVSPLVEKAYTRALDLSKKIKSSPEIFPVLHGRYAFFQVCGLINKAESLVDEFFKLVESQKGETKTLEMIANRMRGSSLVMKGESKKADVYFKKGLATYDYKTHKSLNILYGQDIKVISLTYLGLSQWHQGNIAELYECSEEAYELAKKIPSANTIGISHIVSRVIPYVLLDEAELALEASDKAIEVATKLETPLWKVAGIIFKGWALVRLGNKEEGMAFLEKGVEAYIGMNLGLFRPQIMIIYAQALMETGSIGKALDILEKSLEFTEIGGEHWLDAETHRCIAEVLLRQPEPDYARVKQELDIALETALQQGAITQELKVAMSLFNFAKNKSNEKDITKSRVLLHAAYEKFEDKKSTKDLLRAAELLAESSVSHVVKGD